MEIEMLVRKICEDRCFEVKSVSSFLCECMGRNFHDYVCDSGIAHIGQQFMQGHRVGSGVFGRYSLVTDYVFNCTKKTCGNPGRLQNSAYQIGGCGLPVRAGYAD